MYTHALYIHYTRGGGGGVTTGFLFPTPSLVGGASCSSAGWVPWAEAGSPLSQRSGPGWSSLSSGGAGSCMTGGVFSGWSGACTLNAPVLPCFLPLYSYGGPLTQVSVTDVGFPCAGGLVWGLPGAPPLSFYILHFLTLLSTVEHRQTTDQRCPLTFAQTG